jgi:vacuolar-type H+-ATPase subunit H
MLFLIGAPAPNLNSAGGSWPPGVAGHTSTCGSRLGLAFGLGGRFWTTVRGRHADRGRPTFQFSRGDQEQMNRWLSQYGRRATALVLVAMTVLAGGVLAGCGSDSSNVASTVEKQIEKSSEQAEKIVNEATNEAQEELKKANEEAGATSKQAEEATKKSEEAIEEAKEKANKGIEEGQEMSKEITEEVNKQIEEATP